MYEQTMLKGPNRDLAFLTSILGAEDGGEKEWSIEARRRAVENGLRKLSGERAPWTLLAFLLLDSESTVLGPPP